MKFHKFAFTITSITKRTIASSSPTTIMSTHASSPSFVVSKAATSKKEAAIQKANEYLEYSNQHALDKMLTMYDDTCSLYGTTGTKEELHTFQKSFYDSYGPSLHYDLNSPFYHREEEESGIHLVSFHFIRHWVDEGGEKKSWSSIDHDLIEELSLDGESMMVLKVEVRPVVCTDGDDDEENT
mmetsp:Transcript_37598/g.57314  ORF Transcript_37598/g.57314 Transcript_37598/m.57314 type:complete len:183 (+) Transcript_37598:151-699(+)